MTYCIQQTKCMAVTLISKHCDKINLFIHFQFTDMYKKLLSLKIYFVRKIFLVWQRPKAGIFETQLSYFCPDLRNKIANVCIRDLAWTLVKKNKLIIFASLETTFKAFWRGFVKNFLSSILYHQIKLSLSQSMIHRVAFFLVKYKSRHCYFFVK